jgi:hypothetical protein
LSPAFRQWDLCRIPAEIGGTSNGCSVNPLGFSRHPIKLFATQTSRSGTKQDLVRAGSSAPDSGSILASPSMVHSSTCIGSHSCPLVFSECVPTSPRLLASSNAQPLHATHLDALGEFFSQKVIQHPTLARRLKRVGTSLIPTTMESGRFTQICASPMVLIFSIQIIQMGLS